MNVRLLKSNEFLIKQILISCGKSKILPRLGRFVLICSVTFITVILTNLGNDPPQQKQSLTPLETSLEFSKILEKKPLFQHHYSSAAIASESYPWQLIDKNNGEFTNPWKAILFLTGGFTTWVMVEALLYKKRSVLAILKSDITLFTVYTQPLKQQFVQKIYKITDIIQQRLNSLTFWIGYYQQQEQKIQVLEQKIAAYQNQLFLFTKQQEHLQQIQQELIDIKLQKKASEAIIQEKEKELQILQIQAEEFEQYVLTENHILEAENQILLSQLGSAKEQIRHLQYTLEKNKYFSYSLDSINEDNQDSESFLLAFSTDARDKLAELGETDYRKYRKIFKTLNIMSQNLRHHSLQTHEFGSLSGPDGEKVFESYVEHRTPNAWRVFWYYGPGKQFLTIHDITPHP